MDVENCSSNETGSSSHYESSGKETVFILFAIFAVGALLRHVLKRTPVPYTVLLMVVGLIVGALAGVQTFSFIQVYIRLGNLDPHLMLFLFLPTLIFESAFAMDLHTFRKTVGQAIVIAGPGFLLISFLTAIVARYVFPYNWSWLTALLFATLLSATDPVSVIALLSDLGASKRLGAIIEGEALLNDGAAIVLFNVLLAEMKPGTQSNALDIIIYLVKVMLGGPIVGYIMAKITLFWLSHVFNDALVEITITLASTYLTFYIGEGLLHVSGVLAVVTLGIELNSRRTTISPEVDKFLHRFWSMLGYLANTLIFVLVGIVISIRAFSGVTGKDWVFMFVLYCGIMVIRLVVVGLLMPILIHLGYGSSWKQAVVITWAGLRGAVSLALALLVAQTPEIPSDTIGTKVLFHTAGIVMLTLLINATTVKCLLDVLGMSKISRVTKVTMSRAVRRVREAKLRAINMLKYDYFLADANWEIVDIKTEITDPYRNKAEIVQDSKYCKLVDTTQSTPQYPTCQLPHTHRPREVAELAEEVRVRMIKAERTSYWRQYEQGMLGKDAVLVLLHVADNVLDTPDRLITVRDLSPYWKVPFIFTKIRNWLSAAKFSKPRRKIVKPTNRLSLLLYMVVTYYLFDLVIYGIIAVNGVCALGELFIRNTMALQILEYINVVFVTIYIVEAVLKASYTWLPSKLDTAGITACVL